MAYGVQFSAAADEDLARLFEGISICLSQGRRVSSSFVNS